MMFKKLNINPVCIAVESPNWIWPQQQLCFHKTNHQLTTQTAIIRSLLRSEVSTQTHCGRGISETDRSWIYLNTHKHTHHAGSQLSYSQLCSVQTQTLNSHTHTQQGAAMNRAPLSTVWLSGSTSLQTLSSELHSGALRGVSELLISQLQSQSLLFGVDQGWTNNPLFRAEISLHFSLWQKWRQLAHRDLRDKTKHKKSWQSSWKSSCTFGFSLNSFSYFNSWVNNRVVTEKNTKDYMGILNVQMLTNVKVF